MSASLYTQPFIQQAHAKRVLAELQRRIREAQEHERQLEAAARAKADAILEDAYQEARIIMRRAADEAKVPKRLVIEIIAEVAKQHGFAATALRGKQVTALAARRARREAIRAVAAERKDLSYAEIARRFGVGPRLVHEAVNPRRSHG
ncbi:hypothetical protein [Aquamicrobium zhengzhouense]|uniref:Uncharacterized protein n=1 Tax=Aquamicrobium zhengzhouense TaxID=2781738 RepID=A0ABS0SCI7_9HYPH|nr:hypothetical protein [Aquamicrobium zhengzhouense]MBI1620138.1 hypothetical protein [Aquamicrobium zhengzhouense]